MSSIEIYQIDSFTDKLFHGNPAAVCILEQWLNDELMQAIAIENNLSETAFVVADGDNFKIRWFTPSNEVSLCGHATLAAAFVLFELGKCSGNVLHFTSMHDNIEVVKKEGLYTLDFPRMSYQPSSCHQQLVDLLDQPILEAYDSELDYLVVLESEEAVINLKPDLDKLSQLEKRGLIVTAPGLSSDIYSRCFYPKLKIAEDPVTGSAHCVLTPYWSQRLSKNSLYAIQGLYRKGDLLCELKDQRVAISGSCRWYMKGHIQI